MKSSIATDNEERQNLLEAILENAAHAIIPTTTDGIITSFNRSAEEMLGYTAEELIGKHNPGLLHLEEEVVERSIEFSKKFSIKIDPGFPTFVCHNDLGLDNQFEWTYVRKNGSTLPVLLSITALNDSDGNKTGYLGLAHDISQIKDTENKLKRSNDELSQFAYRTSHDLKAPLSSIKGLVGFIEEDLENNDFDEVKVNLKRISKQAGQLEILVIDILNLAKADLEDQPFELIDLNTFFEDLRESNELSLNKKGVVFSFKTEGESKVNSQVTRLQQILGNLITNSINYSDPNKKDRFIKISSKVKDDFCLIIEDNGIGIPKNKQDSLFDMFTRFHPNKAEGSGLGMSIVYKNIKSLEGDVSFSSSDLGTCFTIKIPLKNNALD